MQASFCEPRPHFIGNGRVAGQGNVPLMAAVLPIGNLDHAESKEKERWH